MNKHGSYLSDNCFDSPFVPHVLPLIRELLLVHLEVSHIGDYRLPGRFRLPLAPALHGVRLGRVVHAFRSASRISRC